ncbi:MAG: BTAD domain-containing putative transcriptional regulator [Gemmatimonadales bacterium]
MLRLETFGGCRVTRDGQRDDALMEQRKSLALLTLLAASRRGVSRDTLLALLWPDSDQEHARTSLKQLVRTIRARLDAPDAILGSADLRLNHEQVTADVTEFRDALSRGDLEAAAALYTGPFLDGFFLKGCDGFERWVDTERGGLAQEFTRALTTLAEREGAHGNPQAAVATWRRLATADPLNARAAVGLMRALDRAGERAAALQHARIYEQLMRSELDAPPDPAVVALVRELRLAAPVAPAGDPPVAAALSPAPRDLPTDGEPLPQETPTGLPVAADPTPARRWRGRGGVVGAGVLGLLVAGFLLSRAVAPAASLIASGQLERSAPLLIAEFEIHGEADPGLGGVLAELVRTALGQSRVVTIVPAPTIRAALERMQQPADAPLGRALAREMALREGIPAVIEGSLASLGDEFVITLSLVAADGEPLTSVHATSSLADLIPTIGELTRQLRSRIGESLRMVRASPPLTQVTTPSLEALRKYVEGAHALHVEQDYATAIRLLQEALRADSSFASAWSTLAAAYRLAAGMPRELANHADEQAYRHRDRLPEPERYAILGSYFRTGPGHNRLLAAEAYEAGLRIDTARFATELGLLYQSRREYARAESLFRWQIDRGNHQFMAYAGLTNVLYAQKKREEAELVEGMASGRTPPTLGRGRVAFYQYNRGQFDSAQHAVEQDLTEAPQTRRLQGFFLLSDLHVARGQFAEAAVAREAAADANRARGALSDTVGAEIWAAWLDIWHRDQRERGLRRLEATLARAPLHSLPLVTTAVSATYLWGELYYFLVAQTFAQGGRPDRAREVLRQFDQDARTTVLRRAARPALHAVLGEIALAEGKPLLALEEFRQADRLPDGPVHMCGICRDAAVGRAFDQAGMADSAIASFERYLETPYLGRISRDATHGAAGMYRRLGELHEASGDRARALHYYARFMEQWRGADPELQPGVTEVRRRIEALRPDR